MRNNAGTKLWGIFLIIIGIGIAGQAFGVWNFDLLFDGWWTLFIIIPCIISIIQNGFNTANTIGIIIGGLLLLSEQNIVRWAMIGRMIFPAILVTLGITVLLKSNSIGKKQIPVYRDAQNGVVNYTVIFGGRDIRFPKAEFNGANITAIFGGINLDLTEAVITKDVTVQVSSIFGGTEIHVPSNAAVKDNCTPIFGGISNKSRNIPAENAPVIYVNALCMFGGVDIK